MTDIIIYTTPENLEHKKGNLDNEFNEYYWKLNRLPKKCDMGDKIYFATKGFIRGYFIILDFFETAGHYAGVPENSITFRCNTWRDIKSVPTKSFQGFKYADKVKELTQCKDIANKEGN